MPCGFGAALEAVLDDDFVFIRGIGELAAFPNVVGNGFFNVGMFAVGGSSGGDEGMGMVGRGDDDGIDFFRFTGFPIIGELGDFDVMFRFQLSSIGIENGGIDIAERDEFCVGAFQKLACQSFATAVETDETDAEIAVGRCGASDGWDKGESSGKGGGGKEMAAGEFHGFLSESDSSLSLADSSVP